jgi:hypothetical protein
MKSKCSSQEKAELQAKLDEAEEKVSDLITLEVKLAEAMDEKRADVARTELASGVEYKDEKAGVSIVYGPARTGR